MKYVLEIHRLLFRKGSHTQRSLNNKKAVVCFGDKLYQVTGKSFQSIHRP